MAYRARSLLVGSTVGLSLACATQGVDSSHTREVPEDPNWSGLQADMDCALELNTLTELSLKDTEVASVQRLRWTASEAIDPSIAIEIGQDSPILAPALGISAEQGERLVLGIPYLQAAQVLVMAELDTGRACSEVLEIDAAALSPGLPELTLSYAWSGLDEGGYTALNLLTESSRYAVIVNDQGLYTWVLDLGSYAVSRVHLGLNQESLLHLRWAPSAETAGQVVRLGLDGEVEAELDIPGVHTDFVELPEGGFAALSWDSRELEDTSGETRKILGDRIVEVSADGEIREIWSAFDRYEPDLEATYDASGYGGPGQEDWTHFNGISHDAQSDDLFVTSYRLNTVLRIDRQTGEVIWELTNDGGDFFAQSEMLVSNPHSVQYLGEDRLLLFNHKGSTDDPDSDQIQCSEAVEIQLDTEAGTATRSWRYSSEECLRVVYFGEAQRLDGGNTMVIFSSSGQISEATPEGETVWQLNTDVGGAFGFGTRFSSLYAESLK